MPKGNNIVHRYFKNQIGEDLVLVKVNPILYTGTEITVSANGQKGIRELEFDEGIFDDLEVDGFVESSALEFNLYQTGLA